MDIQFLGATGRVTGSCYLVRAGGRRLLIECGLNQGEDEDRNREPFPFDVQSIDAVVLSHAHIDHSGRLPLLMKQGFRGPIYTHHASQALCSIMLRDSGYLHEKDAEWTNRKLRRRGLPLVTPLYTREDGEAVMEQFRGLDYGERREILPGISARLKNAGHILGASIVELWIAEKGLERKLAFSGDLGFAHAPVMSDPEPVAQADLVLLESTYGNRLHRSADATRAELEEVFGRGAGKGNIIIPAFAVGRTQDLLYLMAENFERWGLGNFRIFLDSPMAIEATAAYSRFRDLYPAPLFKTGSNETRLPNLVLSQSSEDSMAINKIESGAIIIAASGMCTGGRVLHHLKHNLWRAECQIVIVGYQAQGTLGRRIVDSAEFVRIFGDEVRVNARVHTVGGLSAHADQAGLVDWYCGFAEAPPVFLIHGEPESQKALASAIERRTGRQPAIPKFGDRVDLATRP